MVPWVPQSPGYGSGPGAPQGSLLQAPGTVGPSTLQGVTLDAYGAFTPTRALSLWGSVTLWGRWGVWSVSEIQKPRVKAGDQPEATSCSVVTPGLCPSCAPSTSGCSEEPSWSLQTLLSGEAGGGRRIGHP